MGGHKYTRGTQGDLEKREVLPRLTRAIDVNGAIVRNKREVIVKSKTSRGLNCLSNV